LEGAGEVLLDAHHGSAIVELPTVVGGGEHRHQLLFGEELVPVLDHLVRPADQVQLVLAQEGADDLLSEHEADSALGFAPHLHGGLGVGPQQVAEQTGIRDVGRPHDRVDLVDGGEVGREAAVHAEDAVFDECGHRHAVEAVHEALPQLDVVPALA
jgi:hypothetical protein